MPPSNKKKTKGSFVDKNHYYNDELEQLGIDKKYMSVRKATIEFMNIRNHGH